MTLCALTGLHPERGRPAAAAAGGVRPPLRQAGQPGKAARPVPNGQAGGVVTARLGPAPIAPCRGVDDPQGDAWGQLAGQIEGNHFRRGALTSDGTVNSTGTYEEDRIMATTARPEHGPAPAGGHRPPGGTSLPHRGPRGRARTHRPLRPARVRTAPAFRPRVDRRQASARAEELLRGRRQDVAGGRTGLAVRERHRPEQCDGACCSPT